MKHSKVLNGKRVVVRAADDCLDHGLVVEGIYQYYYRSRDFGLQKDHDSHIAIFSRDEWDVVSVGN